MENLDPKLISKFAAVQSNSSTNIANMNVLPPMPQTRFDAHQKPNDIALNHQMRSALLSIISSKEQATQDVLNLPPPEYLRNIPPPNIASLGSHNLQQSQNNLLYKAPNNKLRFNDHLEMYGGNSNRNRIPMSNLNIMTPPITPPTTIASSFQWNTPTYGQMQSFKKAVHHNLSGPTTINNYQGSLLHVSSPAHELYNRLEECFDQFKMLQDERRKSEYEITKIFPHLKFSSSDDMSSTVLPSRSSRIDHLIDETIREHSKILTMCMKLEFYCSRSALHESIKDALEKWIAAIRKVQATRYNEATQSTSISIPDSKLTTDFKCLPIGEERKRRMHQIRNQFSSGMVLNEVAVSVPQITNEVKILALSKEVNELNIATRMLRTALWKGIHRIPPETFPKPDKPSENVEILL